jgi:uncharacterized protein YoxC
MMKKTIALCLCLLSGYLTFGQATVDPLQENYSLKDRFAIMKAKSQTYQNYKVIKESVLDGVWKIIQDSLNAKQATIRTANQQIAQLKGEVQKTEQAMKAKDESVKEVVYDSAHINVLGIDFAKGVFLSIVGILIAALVAFLVFVMARMKVLDKSIREKTLTINMVSNEYEEYKKKAMEKQTKLSRELQDERNRLQELRRS